MNRIALVTGASSGIGEAFARLLAACSHDLILTARRGDRLTALAAELEHAYGVAVDVVVADLGTAGGRDVVAGVVESQPIDLLVNNAGFGVYAPVAETDPAVLDAMIQLNVLAVMHLTRAALPGMLERRSGSVINVASGLAFDPTATRATYSGTKAFVVNFTRAIDEEVREQGIRVQVLIPGLIRTEFHDTSGTEIGAIPAGWLMDPTDLAAASLTGLERGEVVCVPALPDAGKVAAALDLQAALTRELVRFGASANRYRETTN
ncbi:SDR family NAD(P)-dependent oxidoreductase [Demequina lutea]|uniref:Short-chain dehydrogenase n=1 Tax=Demequina lutea TaxID=431489 RepID=A0A7Y9ZA21_9MICO|nr:SDR family oxidoreductase [Demequina lutea]NYI40985.1 hypothetical protein [Demequina lutea]